MKRMYIIILSIILVLAIIVCGFIIGIKTGIITMPVPGENPNITLNTEKEPSSLDNPSVKPTEEKTTLPPDTTENKLNGKKLIALTFDDGPRTKNTSRIINTLEQYGAKATFFVIGKHIDDNPKENHELLNKAVKIGCEIGSHSYSHRNFSKLSDKEIVNELDAVNKTIHEATGNYPETFRAPYGTYNDRVKQTVNMPFIQWSIDTEDWKYKVTTNDKRSTDEINADIQRVVDSVINHAKDGDIVLMHDFYSIAADACEIIIPTLIDMGFELVTVSELMELRGIEMQAVQVYKNAHTSSGSRD